MNKEGYKIIEELRELFERMEETIPEGYVKVVRCKDCKHFAEELCWNLYGRCTPVSDMDYCSNGERRDDNETERKEDNDT